jgi:hypothetical protein
LRKAPALITPGVIAAVAPPPTIIGHATAPITAPVTAHSTTGTAVPIVGEVCAAADVESVCVPTSATAITAQAAEPDLINIPLLYAAIIVELLFLDNSICNSTPGNNLALLIALGDQCGYAELENSPRD